MEDEMVTISKAELVQLIEIKEKWTRKCAVERARKQRHQERVAARTQAERAEKERRAAEELIARYEAERAAKAQEAAQ